MRVENDRQVDAAYMHLEPSENAKADRTYAFDPAKTGGQIELDFDEGGRLIGLEVLNASRLLPAALLKAEAQT